MATLTAKAYGTIRSDVSSSGHLRVGLPPLISATTLGPRARASISLGSPSTAGITQALEATDPAEKVTRITISTQIDPVIKATITAETRQTEAATETTIKITLSKEVMTGMVASAVTKNIDLIVTCSTTKAI